MTTPQQLAERVCHAMYAQDAASQALGMVVVAIAPGAATLTMPVRADMLNGHDTCHGGFVAALADSAFAFACNAGNEQTVASGFDINFLAPVHGGDVLTATAAQRHRAGRTGVYDVAVTNQHGARVAEFRGRSYALKGRRIVEDFA